MPIHADLKKENCKKSRLNAHTGKKMKEISLKTSKSSYLTPVSCLQMPIHADLKKENCKKSRLNAHTGKKMKEISLKTSI